MIRGANSILCAIVASSLAGAWAFAGGGLQIPWHSIDGGGTMDSAGGGLTLSGSIGQHDANDPATAMNGGEFSLVGGFWAGTLPSCACLGDMNSDGMKDGADIQKFVNCLIVGGSCACADVDAVNGVDIGDVDTFVTDLLGGSACP